MSKNGRAGYEGENERLAMRWGNGTSVNHAERIGGAEINRATKDVWNLWSQGPAAELYLLIPTTSFVCRRVAGACGSVVKRVARLARHRLGR